MILEKNNKLTEPIYWRVDTFPPSPSEMTNEELGNTSKNLLKLKHLNPRLLNLLEIPSAEEELVNLNAS